MALASDMLDRLAPLPDPAVDRALAAALPTADPATFAATAALLLARRHPAGLLGLIVQYHRLPGEVAQELVRQVDELYRPLREAAGQGGAAALGALAIIRQSAATPLLYLVTQQLKHGDAEPRAAAADTLLHFARLAAPDPEGESPPMLPAEAAAAVASAVDEAVEHYAAHERREVLLALATLLPRPMPRALTALARVGHPGLEPMRRLCENADEPAVRRALPLLAGTPSLTDAALTGLRRCAASGELTETLQQVHLWTLPRAARALLRVRLGDRALPADPLELDVDPGAMRHVPALIAALPMELPARLARLGAMAAAPDPAARIRALRTLLRLLDAEAGPGVLDTVARFTEDPEPAIAQLALWPLIHKEYPGLSRVLGALLQSPHEGLRQIASQRLGPVGFARFWAQWPRLSPPQRFAAGRALIKIDTSFHRRLGDKLQSGDRLTKLRALSILEVLSQGAFFEKALLALSRDRDETLASAAVKALGSVESAAARLALDQALHSADARVRANAVEALAQHNAIDHHEDLLRLAEGPDHRPRANAIAALMTLEPARAMAALADMLRDDRQRHRTSALWLVETLGLVELARQVAEMAVSDPEPNVQTRAHRVVHDLMQMMATTPGLEALEAAMAGPGEEAA